MPNNPVMKEPLSKLARLWDEAKRGPTKAQNQESFTIVKNWIIEAIKSKVSEESFEAWLASNDFSVLKEQNWTEARIARPVNCDFCGHRAEYDGKTVHGPWAYMCPECFKKYGVGIGRGSGQKLIVEGGQ